MRRLVLASARAFPWDGRYFVTMVETNGRDHDRLIWREAATSQAHQGARKVALTVPEATLRIRRARSSGAGLRPAGEGDNGRRRTVVPSAHATAAVGRDLAQRPDRQ